MAQEPIESSKIGYKISEETKNSLLDILFPLPYEQVAALITAVDAATPTDFEELKCTPQSIMLHLLSGMLDYHFIYNVNLNINGKSLQISDTMTGYGDSYVSYDEDSLPGPVAASILEMINMESKKCVPEEEPIEYVPEPNPDLEKGIRQIRGEE